jgi:hypothetical protein
MGVSSAMSISMTTLGIRATAPKRSGAAKDDAPLGRRIYGSSGLRDDALEAVQDAKLARMPSETLYAMPRTLCHSLEAFAGHVDINRLRPWWQADESVMGHPA